MGILHRYTILPVALIWISFTHPATASDLNLSLKEAIGIALSPEGSTEVQIAEETVREVLARSQQSRAELLPHLGASIGYQNQTRNLEAMGLQPTSMFRPPTLVGPFTTFDARANLTQTIFNLGSLRRFQASKVGVRVAETEKENIEERTAAQVARFYLEALRNRARLDAARANLELATALADLAENQKEAGMGTGIEVTRAQVQVSNEQQRVLGAEQQHRQSLLRLLKLIGIRLDTNLILTENLTNTPVQVADMEEALAIALRSRSDLQALQKREEQADLGYRAARSDRIPSLSGFAGYGTIGSGIDSAIPTWNLGVTLELPVFDGGRVDARRAEALSRLRRERIEGQDLRRQIELEIRLAFAGLNLAREQITVAEEGLQLAQQELEQARRRYQAGITSSLEVTDAQTRLERARENQITALFDYNLERINLGEAMGTIRSMIQ
jgi:outer membrane protein TolC